MAITAARGYGALVASCADVSGQALRATAGESAEVAQALAQALRAPDTARSAATERAMWIAYHAQRRQLQMMRGYASLFGMTLLNTLDAAGTQRRAP